MSPVMILILEGNFILLALSCQALGAARFKGLHQIIDPNPLNKSREESRPALLKKGNGDFWAYKKVANQSMVGCSMAPVLYRRQTSSTTDAKN